MLFRNGCSYGALGFPRLTRGRSLAFSLIELLVVVSIIALLIGIILPVLGRTREHTRGIQSLSNVRQIGIGLNNYVSERRGYYPIHSSEVTKIGGTKPRWVDYIFAYIPSETVFLSPNLDEREKKEFKKVFWHEVSVTSAEDAALNGSGVARNPLPSDLEYHGGYAYNFQYLGNARKSKGVGFNARLDSDIRVPSNTVALGDAAGSRKGNSGREPGDGSSAVYSLDSPIGSARGSGKGSYYEGGSDENVSPYDPDFTYLWRSFPKHRNSGVANFVFTDGHGQGMTRAEVDDFNDDGVADNGYWNGRADPNWR